jgi:hypothetical protein
VSCAARDACAEVGTGAFVGEGNEVGWWNGHKWRLKELNDGSDNFRVEIGMSSVSCPSVTFCMAVGSGAADGSDVTGAAIAWNGSGWGREAFPPQLTSTGFGPVSCASRAACVAVNVSSTNGTSVVTFNGSRWTRTASAFHAYPTAITCPVVGWCMVVGYLFNPKTGGPLTPAAARVR